MSDDRHPDKALLDVLADIAMGVCSHDSSPGEVAHDYSVRRLKKEFAAALLPLLAVLDGTEKALTMARGFTPWGSFTRARVDDALSRIASLKKEMGRG